MVEPFRKFTERGGGLPEMFVLNPQPLEFLLIATQAMLQSRSPAHCPPNGPAVPATAAPGLGHRAQEEAPD
jgi:hypothetical protein